MSFHLIFIIRKETNTKKIQLILDLIQGKKFNYDAKRDEMRR